MVIMEINMKPTWNSIELTAEDIKNICNSNSNKIYNYIKMLKEKNFINIYFLTIKMKEKC